MTMRGPAVVVAVAVAVATRHVRLIDLSFEFTEKNIKEGGGPRAARKREI
jgi:hypothetical protein